MSEDLGGGMYARQLRQVVSWNSKDDIEVHIWTDRTSAFTPSLVVPNLYQVKKLRDYLDSIIEKHPDYFKRRDE